MWWMWACVARGPAPEAAAAQRVIVTHLQALDGDRVVEPAGHRFLMHWVATRGRADTWTSSHAWLRCVPSERGVVLALELAGQAAERASCTAEGVRVDLDLEVMPEWQRARLTTREVRLERGGEAHFRAPPGTMVDESFALAVDLPDQKGPPSDARPGRRGMRDAAPVEDCRIENGRLFAFITVPEERTVETCHFRDAEGAAVRFDVVVEPWGAED